jgi:phage portal protein BeeE
MQWNAENATMKVSNEDMQYLDSRRFQRAEIAGGIFGVPLHFLGDLEKATLNNVEQQSLEFSESPRMNPLTLNLAKYVSLSLSLSKSLLIDSSYAMRYGIKQYITNSKD